MLKVHFSCERADLWQRIRRLKLELQRRLNRRRVRTTLLTISGPKGADILADITPSEKLLRIRALLAQWMRMENLAVLTASGCSCGENIGGKTLTGLENAVIGVLQARYDPKKKEDAVPKQIVDARAARRGDKGSQPFETWLTHISNTEHLLGAASSPIQVIGWSDGNGRIFEVNAADAKRLLLDIEHSIYGFCALQLPEIEEGVTGHHAFFAKLIARDPSLGRAHIFTVNYDTVIEQALDQLGILFSMGSEEKRRPNSTHRYTVSMFTIRGTSVRGVYAATISFCTCTSSTAPFIGISHQMVRFELSIRTLISSPRGGGLNRDQVRANKLDELWPPDRRIAILPTANKFVQTFDLPFSHLFRAFHQRLNTPQTFFIVVGYGFGDDHLNEIIDVAMTNPSLIMLIVNPNPTEELRVKLKRYQDIGERVFLLCPAVSGQTTRATFEDFAINLMPQVQWLEDFVKLRRYEKTISDGPAGEAIGDGQDENEVAL